MHFLRRFPALVACATLAGCASVSGTRDRGNNDPLEPMNRVVFNANDAIDASIIRPIAEGYRAVVPQFVRDRIRAFIDNLQEPRIFVNNLLQLRIDDAGITFARFSFNSTFGLAGMFDVASRHGLSRQTGDFGETLYMWGVDSGPYLVLPLFGASNIRDAFGLTVDLYTTPPAHLFRGSAGIWINVGVYTVSGFDLRSRNIETLDHIKTNSLDYYAQFRSIAQQYREGQLRAARGLVEEPPDLVDPGAPAD
ncbi:MAG: VacJ family lipoprotein [Burkholderiales bacterium]|jgi:phospholipid-binding lipoprotein MlaA